MEHIKNILFHKTGHANIQNTYQSINHIFLKFRTNYSFHGHWSAERSSPSLEMVYDTLTVLISLILKVWYNKTNLNKGL